MKTLFSFLFILLVTSQSSLIAQDYRINFSGSGESSTVASVKVENLNRGTSLTMVGSNTLHLVNTTTGIVDLLQNQNAQILFYPNPMKDYSMMKFDLPEDGFTVISLLDISGRNILQSQDFLSRGEHTYKLEGLNSGFYLVNIKSGEYSLSGRFVSNGAHGFEPRIAHLNTNLSENESDVQVIVSQKDKNMSKGSYSETTMQYTIGDRLKFTGYSGKFSTVLTDVPYNDKTISFTFISCTDVENNNYPVVKIGSTWWMAKNLNYLPAVSPSSSASTTNPYYYIYDYQGTNISEAKATTNFQTYGVLYNWQAAKNSCPAGWHLPSYSEWITLDTYLKGFDFNYDGTNYQNKYAKSIASTTYWTQSAITGAPGNLDFASYRNKTGFTALPGGSREYSGSFLGKGQFAYWWSTTETSESNAWRNGIIYDKYASNITDISKSQGHYVRCVQNQSKNETAFPGVKGELKVYINNGDTIIYETIKGKNVFQGDIILTEDQITSSKGTGWSLLSKRWPERTVYYSIDKNFIPIWYDFIKLAIKEFEENTSLKFIERKGEYSNVPDYVEIINSEVLEAGEQGTWSYQGYLTGRQEIGLEPSSNNFGNVIHELNHTIGLMHEHTRSDRDDWIVVFKDNIYKEVYDKNYKAYSRQESFHTSTFDFESVMLYPGKNFWDAIDPSKPVMIDKRLKTAFDCQRIGFSKGDIEMINLMYMSPSPEADFRADKTIVPVNEKVNFTDLSLNDPKGWVWNFGDGETSLEQNPSHIYKTVGTFTVSLRSKNDFDFDDEVKTNYITVTQNGLETGTITDQRDGKVYNTIKIGNQWWMAENLVYLPSINNSSEESLTNPYYYVYGYQGSNINDAKANFNYQTYGVLYNWPAAILACPTGWDLPTDAEWTTLENYLIANGYNFDGTTSGNKIAKALASSSGWSSSSTIGAVGNTDYLAKRNATGFTALPSGYRIYNGTFTEIGNYSLYWSSDVSSNNFPYCWYLYKGSSALGRGINPKSLGLSIRCLRD